MRKKIILIGALTNKPYAFQSRSWELKQLETIDLYDSLCSNIKINYRGSDILRILPNINENINEEWISDKARFAYDALNKWRYSTPWYKSKNKFIKISWKESFEVIKLNKKQKKLVNTSVFLGPYIDLKTQVYTKKLMSKEKQTSLFVSNEFNCFTTDYLNDITINLTNLKSKTKKVFLFLGVNLRLENPILNIKFRNLSKKNNCLFLIIGPSYLNNCYMFHIGLTFKTLVNLLEGKHWCSIILNNYKKINCIAGYLTIGRLDSVNIYNTLKSYKKLSLTYLHLFSGYINSNYINFFNNSKNLNQNNTLIWLLGTKNLTNISNKSNKFVIYQGHHLKSKLDDLDLILPSKTFYETNQKYLNCLNILQETNSIPFVEKNIKENWKIVKLLSKYVFNNILSAKVDSKLFLQTKKLNYLNNNTYNSIFFKNYLYKNNKFFNSLIKKLNSNYYLSDSITQASVTMKNCSKTFFQNKYIYLWK